jgi:hypothetical protein
MFDLSKFLASMIEHALQEGLRPPLYIVYVSANGQVLALRDECDGNPGTVLCEYLSGDSMESPINVYFSDGSAKALRAVLEAAGEPHWIN